LNDNVLSLTDGYLKDELAAVRERILGTIQADLPIADDVLVYAFGRGGKWIRPRLVMLAHRAVGGADRRAVVIAAAIEMVHLATLLHDDVIDESGERRGRASANMRYGNRTAVLGGDYLYTKVFLDLLTEIDQPEIINLVAGVTNEMSVGEFFQMWWQGKLNLSEEDYFNIIEKKSASLMRTAARCGALAAGGNGGAVLSDGRVARGNGEAVLSDGEAVLSDGEAVLSNGEAVLSNGEAVRALTAYGLNFGLAFQITDDCMDFTSPSDVMGKDELNDVREGKVTLPLIYGLRTGARKRLAGLVESFWNGDGGSECASEILTLLEDSGALGEAETTARRYGEMAKDRLAELAPGDARDYLARLADWSWQRST
jgi:octaprenyl-diphosphate synthase